MSAKRKKGLRESDWYTLSVDSVRLWLGLLLCAVTALGLFYGFRAWRIDRQEQQAVEWIARTRGLVQQVRAEDPTGEYGRDLQRARTELEQADIALASAEFVRATDIARTSYRSLERIHDQVSVGGSIAWFVGVHGEVRYRRGESGQFRRAYPQGVLFEGDYVRSSGGATAEIHFRSEQARFTLRPNSLVKLSSRGTDGVASNSLGFMEYGWVSVDTAERASSVETPFTELRVSENSKASIELTPQSGESTIRVDEGSAQARSVESGAVQELQEREQVVQDESDFGRVESVPGSPDLVDPPDNFSINIDTTNRVELVWKPVEQAQRYALQVSRTRMFGENVIDVSGRPGTIATLGLRETGSYMWRVAAYNRSGTLGSWSEVRKFRVSSYRKLAIEDDTDPPTIELDIIMNGNIAILTGRTEPGARLDMDGDPIELAADGTFSTSRVIYNTGRVELVFRARDEAGNNSVVRRRVFIDEN